MDTAIQPGTEIKIRRQQLGYAQAAFARLLGLTRTTLSDLERGEIRDPDKINEAMQILDVLESEHS